MNERRFSMVKKHGIVTGGYGFIGSNFVNHFRERFDKLMIIDKMTYAADIKNIIIDKDRINHSSYNDIKDITYSEFSSMLKSMDIPKEDPIILVNFAAESHVDNSIESSSIFAQTNFLGVQNLLDILIKRKNPDDKFVQISTDEIYGSIEEGEFYEDSPLRPNNPYSATKAAAELLIRSYIITHGINACITRCCNNYGPNQAEEKFIPTVISSMLDKTQIPVYGTGENIREWIFVKDHCQAIMDVILYGEAGEIYNIGSGYECTNLEMINKLAYHLSKKTHVRADEYLDLISFVPDRPGHDLRYKINWEKIKESLDWLPLINIDEGLDTTISFYLSKKL